MNVNSARSLSTPSFNPANLSEQERENLERVCEQQAQQCQKYATLSQQLRLFLTAIVLLTTLSILTTTAGWISVKAWAIKSALFAGIPGLITLVAWFYTDRKYIRILYGLRTNQQRLKNTSAAPISGTFTRSR